MTRRVGLLFAGVGLVVASVLIAATTMRAGASDGELCQRHQTDAAERAAIVTGEGRPILVVGDSWSVGLGLSDLGASWPSRLPGRVSVAGFSGSGFSERASHCGDHAFATRVPAARDAQLVVVAGGLNDHDQPDAEIRAGFGSLVRSLAGHDLVVVGPAPAPARAARVERVEALLARLCEEFDVAYIDSTQVPLSYLPDRLHLTPAGHAAFGAHVAEELVDRGLIGWLTPPGSASTG